MVQRAYFKNKTPDMIRKEKAGAAKLQAWCKEARGRAAALSRHSGIVPPVISRMMQGKAPISMEDAIRLDLAMGGQITAEELCPAMADVISAFRVSK